MIFKQLSVQHFKRLRNSTFDFKPGINIIKGENETGKSTMKFAFLTALFTGPRSEPKARKIQTWGTDFKSRITLKFLADGNSFVLVKDFQERKAILVDGRSGRQYEDPISIQRIIGETIGIGSKDLFESTAYIDHMMVADINKGRKEIRESLGASLTGAGGDASAEQIVKKISKIVSDMEKGLTRPTVKPGVIRTLKDKIVSLEKRLLELNKSAAELEKGASLYEEVIAKLDKVESDYVAKKRLYESNKRYYELKEKEEKLEKEYGELDHRIEGIKDDQRKLESLNQRLKELGFEQKTVPNWIFFAGTGIGVVVLALVLIVLNIWWILITLVSIPLFVYSVVLFRREGKINKLLSEKAVVEASIKGKRGRKSISEMESEGSRVRRKLKDVEEELLKPEMKARVSPEEYHKLASEIKELEEKREEFRDRKSKGEVYLEERRVSESEMSEIEEELEVKREELRQQLRKCAVYKMTSGAIEEAFSKTLSPARDILKKKVAEYFEIITGGRYNKIKLEEGTLEFKVYSPEKNDWVSIVPKDEELSRGTIDQFFLAARLALIDVVSRGKKPPIFLDDPFVTFDEPRLKRAMKLLAGISKDHQIFIFTCKDSYDEFADNILSVNL